MAFGLKSGVEGEPLKEKKKLTAAEEAWDLAKTVFYAVAIALVLRIALFQPFNIPSGSMQPNLLVGDFLFVSKPAYGYSRASLVYPLTRLPIEGRLFGKAPERGDIVVFKNRKDHNKDYIKRVIGLPGDEIRMINGRLHINGEPVRKEFIGMQMTVCGARMREAPIYRETLDNGVSYIVEECDGDNNELDNTPSYYVPAGHYFMMGDNRDHSQDSRVLHAVGFVPEDDLVGKAERLFFSVDGSKARLWEVWKWPFAVRYGRIFDPVR
ncbi:signal peptidase I [Amphiplicatus metriothermophilus]|uniref:Signal peptidase I n=1 Tax=Amphiplicatus metriothermophilus TaxID=1519374 RepID=A0A239PP48_9PROT|nr:signal peptidase I [Amphiplicatus metriothermophilus]MBB5518771.1 signal peptidase I [Amphiplicatus metriothermophilus]SNT72074.1 signal peptidase I Serine peptidase. MEROPS family S26A [Amphiplicatus metriothermophilus]